MNAPGIWFPEHALDVLVAEAESALPNETGGILLGYLAANSDVVVTEVVGPGPAAVHSPEGFSPDYAFHEACALARWEADEGTEFYLGDWHSHPGSEPHLSRKDRRALWRIATAEESGIERPYMAVLGRGDPWALGVWRYRRRRWRLLPPRSPIACKISFYTEP